MVCRFVSGLGGLGLFRYDGAEGDEELVVDCSGMVYYCAGNYLDVFDASGI